MNSKLIQTKLFAIMLALISLTAILAACSSTEVQDREIAFEVSDGKINLDPPLIEVNQGDTVTLKIDSKDHGSIHLHGYDIEMDIGPDATTDLPFTAAATGRFIFTFHAAGDEHDEHEPEGDHDTDGHASMFESETLHEGDSFSFEFMQAMNDKTVKFHNHMHHEMHGEISISETASVAESVEIQIANNGSFSPHDISIQPGTTVVWVNTGTERQRIASGEAPSADEHDDHEAEATDEHDDHEEGEEEEVTLGTVEVRPR